MSKKKYTDFPTGTYDTSKVFLQADPNTGELTKVNLPSITGGGSSYDVLPLSMDGSYGMRVGDIITAIVIDSTPSCTLSIGSTVGGNDIANSLNIVGGTPLPISVLIYAKTSQTIYFTGIAGFTNILIIKNSA